MKKILCALLGIFGMFAMPAWADEQNLFDGEYVSVVGGTKAENKNPIYVIPGNQYKISWDGTPPIGVNLSAYNISGQQLHDWSTMAGTSPYFSNGANHWAKDAIWTVPNDVAYIKFNTFGTMSAEAQAAWAASLKVYRIMCANMFNLSTATANKLVYANSGTLRDDPNGFYVSDYIPVQANETYIISPANIGTSVYGMAWYDANKQYISGSLFNYDVLRVTAPANAVFARTSYKSEWGDTFSFRPAYCSEIQVASTKYVETQFSDLGTRLAAAVATVNTVVTNTITQAASIATLQSGKQTRPADDTCPAGKKCLLVEGTDGKPHWYEICSSAHCLPEGYTELGYIESTGTQWIDTGNVSTGSDRFVSLWNSINASGNKTFYGASNGSIATGERSLFWMDTSGVGVDLVWPTGANTGTFQHIAGAWGASGDYLFDDNLTSFTYNGTSVSRSVSRNFTSRYHLFLFAVSRNGVDPIAVSNVRLKYFKWYRNDELIHEYIPAKRNSDGVIGLYDTVNNRFYTNAGTGTFIAGPVAE